MTSFQLFSSSNISLKIPITLGGKRASGNSSTSITAPRSHRNPWDRVRWRNRTWSGNGLERYQQHRETIDAVLLDMVMPVKSGLETYKELMAIAPECKVILASGFKEDARVLKVMELGADFFIQKPYTLQEISQVLEDLLNN